ncbi:MAG: hypothetical protein JWO03_786 [Bacteroidetes bacterium]|nr:hypothetical protein [Bacteroidota bacterium]
MKENIVILLFLICSFNISSLKAQRVIDFSPLRQLKTIKAKQFPIEELKSNGLSIVVFYSPLCPICQNYTKTLKDIHAKYKDIPIYLIYPSFTTSEIKRFETKYDIPFTSAQDQRNIAVKLFSATVTPQCFLMNNKGEILYSGKIDNWYEDIGKRRTIITENYLVNAIESYRLNKPIIIPSTQPVGCFIN